MGASDRGPKLRDEGGGTKTKSKGKSSKSRKNATRGGGDSLTSTLLLVGAGVALVPLIRRVREWMDARRGTEPSKASNAGSAFTFGKKGKKGKGKKAAKGERATADAPMRKPPGAAAAARGSNASMPRSGKMQSNKKNKARKAERKEERQAEKTKDAHKAGQLPPSRGGTTVIREGNNVPKDEDIIGGEAGKTFTTTSHVKVPTWYAKVREERGND